MNSRKHRQLKRNPLVRFIRGVFRLLRVIFKPKNRNLRSLQVQQKDLPQVELRQQVAPEIQPEHLSPKPLKLDRDQQEQFITVGELFEQIKWQIPAETVIQTNISDLKIPQSYDPSRN